MLSPSRLVARLQRWPGNQPTSGNAQVQGAQESCSSLQASTHRIDLITPSISFPQCTNLNDGVPDTNNSAETESSDNRDTQLVAVLATAGAVLVDNLVHDGHPVGGTAETQLVEVLATAGAAHVDNLVQDGDPAQVEGT